MYLQKVKPFLYLGIFYLIVSFLLRLVFVFHPITTADFSFAEVLKVTSLGLVNDILVFTIASSFLALYFLFLSNGKYQNPYGQIILGVLVLAFIYILATPNNIFKQYGGGVVKIVLAFLGLKILFFALMLFLPKQRLKIRNSLYFTTLFLYVLLIIFNAVSEYFFYNEFGVRYNFIAVDYLIYTTEVIGNIMESYPIIPLFTAIFVVTGLATWWIYKKTKDSLLQLPNLVQKLTLLGVFAVLLGISLSFAEKINLKKGNIFQQEIAANGMVKFYEAFSNNTLDFFTFYPTVDQKAAEKNTLLPLGTTTLSRTITSDKPELQKNVVLISIESLSAAYMKAYGYEESVTPFLDQLAQKSLFFTNLYATGNRTVRGLEALTLCIPPTAGESVIKREKENKNKFTTGSVFKSKGYSVKYLYGGYSYFDNMKDFYGGNGYEIVDRDNFTPEEITFANVWGVCDEDMAKKAISEMNKDYKAGKPFFHHWMTVSNHRPFTYPEGKIDIPADSKSRKGGVKYTDYSIMKFFEMAQKQPWFKNTVFVIVADHCSSSAGKTELPMDKYRIPAMIYSPEFVAPQKFSQVTSQIDVMPTVLGLLNFKYQSKFLGQDVFSKNFVPRAYIATYQDLGFVKDNYLTVISPTKNIKQYQLVQKPNTNTTTEFNIYYTENLLQDNPRKDLVDQTISNYQSTSFWLKNKMLDK
ncbi:LTA synthase family protein [Cloacibacterium normanense]|uniref:Type I phosphodiesterase / nucleotide pyrophosphatase family protein n=1 Tax=Cloacibacterium normanense TaxID=237258 RepID=A0A1E5UC52_9FLAO|nr:alkaline phosphatase family protein [Cloacibacterium normanense]AZI70532.1 alkaline phosphatase family protein [Cloacibacterium normanense]OEL10378.1 type I phosphodiesterase / nucleotide pyrophosphatase family protein [Cloacibacterium normanense]SDO48556.1 Phosphoglycerol transferase MdoB [Cloacibacterium normanense]